MSTPENRLAMPLPPPVAFLILLILGGGAGRWWPLSLGIPDLPRHILAVVCAVLSGAWVGWAFWTLNRHRASPEFKEEVHTLVQSGPFRYSRNPMYLSLLLLKAFFVFMLDNGWMGLGFLCLYAHLRYHVMPREEAFLARLFGETYRAYCSKTRRWL